MAWMSSETCSWNSWSWTLAASFSAGDLVVSLSISMWAVATSGIMKASGLSGRRKVRPFSVRSAWCWRSSMTK